MELDQVGSDIFALLVAGASVAEIAQDLADKYEVSVETAAEDIDRFLGYLVEDGLAVLAD